MPAQSERADGRAFDSESLVLGKLRAHRPLTERLEYPDSVAESEGASRIIPAPNLARLRQSSSDDPPAVVVAVGYVTGSTQRDNLQEQRNHTLDITFECRDSVLSHLGVSWAQDCHDEIASAATELVEGSWYQPELSGGTDGLQWNDALGRWQSIIRMQNYYWG